MTVHGAQLNLSLAERSAEISGQLAAQLDYFENRSGDKVREAAHQLDELIARIDGGLEARSQTFNEALTRRAIEIARVLGEGGRDVTQALDAKAREIDEILLGRSSELSETLGAKAQEINATLGGRASEIAETLDGRISEFESRVVGRLDAVSNEINGRGMQVAQALETRVGEFESRVVARLTDVSADIDSRGRSVVDLIANRVQEIGSTLNVARRELDLMLHERTGELGETLIKRVTDANTAVTSTLESLESSLRTRGETLAELLATRANDLHQIFDTQGPLLIDLLTARGDEVSKEMTSVGELVTNAIEQRGSAVVEHLARKQADIVAAVGGVHDKVRDELGAVLTRLGETHGALQGIVGQASSGLSALDQSLLDKLRDFRGAIEQAAGDVTRLTTNATTVVGDAQTLAASVGEQNVALTQAVSELSRAQTALDHTLESRRTSLQAMLEEMDRRRDDFDNVLAAFSGLVENAFRTSESRAREIGTFLTEAAQSTAVSVEQQFGEIRSATGRERERTAAALRSAYEQANEEMGRLFGDATERFTAAATDIRGMTAEIQRELEATRRELARSAADLPREALEQASAMRRIVGEQVKAVSELSSIVERATRSHDVAEANPAPAPAPRVEQPAPRPEPAPAAPVTARFEQRRPLAPAPARAPREEAPRPRAAGPALRPSNEPASTERGPGWLSGILARASRDDEAPPAPPPAKPIDSLDALSLDIARMLDHAAVVDLWERYRRGEQNVFDRRLYTPQGQGAFDEIRRRYRGEREFRDTVDRYIQEFERLLSEVSRDDRDGALAKSYLVSDTGKVYTMLAHAAQRFE